MSRRPRSAFPSPDHDHRGCSASAIARAETLCASRKLRFTAIRRAVLKAVWQSHSPVGAYDILAKLNAKGADHAPMAVYRALDFLLENGFIHRISSQNAFIGCPHPETEHDSQLLICRHCGTVAEIDSAPVTRALKAAAPGFAIEQRTIEISGVCPHCRSGAHA